MSGERGYCPIMTLITRLMPLLLLTAAAPAKEPLSHLHFLMRCGLRISAWRRSPIA
ncbi:hypothetical protein QP164_01110 [Sphingomonas sp. LR59]|uniref:hypothetical protein n=1 Tax=Sphingomonas sp. LR59 TaxID=3050232 RepID=UPI002FDF70D9